MCSKSFFNMLLQYSASGAGWEGMDSTAAFLCSFQAKGGGKLLHIGIASFKGNGKGGSNTCSDSVKYLAKDEGTQVVKSQIAITLAAESPWLQPSTKEKLNQPSQPGLTHFVLRRDYERKTRGSKRVRRDCPGLAVVKFWESQSRIKPDLHVFASSCTSCYNGHGEKASLW